MSKNDAAQRKNRKLNRRSLTFRLIAWYCGLLFLLDIAFAALTYAGFTYYLHNTILATLATIRRRWMPASHAALNCKAAVVCGSSPRNCGWATDEY
jgi:hypothetical protein